MNARIAGWNLLSGLLIILASFSAQGDLISQCRGQVYSSSPPIVQFKSTANWLSHFHLVKWKTKALQTQALTRVHCVRCAACHRSMGAHISKIKHLKLDQWEDSQVARMKEVRQRYHPKLASKEESEWSSLARWATWMPSWNMSNGCLQVIEKLTVRRLR